MSDVSFIGGAWGNLGWQPGETSDLTTDWQSPAIGGSTSLKCPDSSTAGAAATNITFDGVHFGNNFQDCQNATVYGSNPQSTCAEPTHPDCLHVFGETVGLTIKNSWFDHCMGFYLELNVENNYVVDGQALMKDAVFENDIFGDDNAGGYDSWNQLAPGGTGPLYVVCDNVVFRNNTFGHDQSPNPLFAINCPLAAGATKGVQFYNNIFTNWGTSACPSTATFDHNLFITGPTCGTNVYSGAADFINATDAIDSTYSWAAVPWTSDFHLQPASAAIGRGAAANCPSADFDGVSRPAGSPCDLGAFQHAAMAANIWVSTTGNDTTCVRGDQTKPCASFDKAYTLAQPGDTVAVAAGDYAKQAIYGDATKNITDGTCSITPAGQNLSACITFSPAGGKVTVKGIVVMASGLRFVGLDIVNAGVGVTWKDNPSGVPCKKVGQPHDIIFDSIKNYATGGVPAPGASPGGNASASGVYNVAFVNSDFGPFYDSVGTAQFSNLTPASSSYCAAYPVEQLKDKNIYLYNNVWHDLYQTVVSNGPNCGNDPAQYECNHMECIHWRASNSWIINNKFLDCAQNDVSVQTFGSNVPNIDNLQIIGNVFDRPCSNQTAPCGTVSALPLICSTAGDSITNTVVAYNSIWGSPSFQKDNCTSASTFAGSVAVGNLSRSTSSDFSCSTKINVGAAFRYNAWDSSSTQACDATGKILSGDFPWSSPAYPDYNFSLVDGSGAANFVPKTVVVSGKTITCPSYDIAGSPRPAAGSSMCAAGAYETSQTSVTLPPGVGTGGNVPPPTNPPSTNPPSTTPTPTPTPSYPTGDLNHDGQVDIYDLSILLSNYGSSASTTQGDLNHDGQVSIYDLSILLSRFGT